jgi:hypothetical protein
MYPSALFCTDLLCCWQDRLVLQRSSIPLRTFLFHSPPPPSFVLPCCPIRFDLLAMLSRLRQPTRMRDSDVRLGCATRMRDSSPGNEPGLPQFQSSAERTVQAGGRDSDTGSHARLGSMTRMRGSTRPGVRCNARASKHHDVRDSDHRHGSPQRCPRLGHALTRTAVTCRPGRAARRPLYAACAASGTYQRAAHPPPGTGRATGAGAQRSAVSGLLLRRQTVFDR